MLYMPRRCRCLLQLSAVGTGVATSSPKNPWCRGVFFPSKEALWQGCHFSASLISGDCSYLRENVLVSNPTWTKIDIFAAQCSVP